MSKSKGLIIVLTILTFVVLTALGLFIYYSQGNINLPLKTDTNKKIQVQQPKVSLEQKIKQNTYQEIQKEEPAEVINPNISDPEQRKVLDKTITRQSDNKVVRVENGKLIPDKITILQKDIVTWKNFSDSEITIVGENEEWGSFLSIEPNKSFSQEFSFMGTYTYTVTEYPDLTGEIIVVKGE